MTVPSAFSTWRAGDQGTLTLTARDTDGSVLNISGFFVHWGLSAPNLSGTTLITKSYPASGINLVQRGISGVFTVALSGVDTAALAGDYHQEAARVGVSGSDLGIDKTVLVGTLRIRPTII